LGSSHLGEEAETIALDQTWIINKEIIHGRVKAVDEDIIVLEVHIGPIVYINAEEVKMFWGSDFDYHKCMEGSLTKRLPGAKNKDK
jgi:hypothetical protein